MVIHAMVVILFLKQFKNTNMKHVYIVRVEMLTANGLQPFMQTKVFETISDAQQYQESVNADEYYKKLNAFAFLEIGAFIEEN